MDQNLDILFSRLEPEDYAPELIENICSRLFENPRLWKMARGLIASYGVLSKMDAGESINSGLLKVHEALCARNFKYQRPGSSFWWAHKVLCHETHRLCREAAREKKIDLTSSQYDAKDSEEDPLTLIDEKEVHPEALNPREELMRQEIRLAVELCFDSSLNEIEKSVLILCYHQFKSVIDVADELKIPKGSVGRYAHYAKARINDCLRKRYGIEPMDFYRSL